MDIRKICVVGAGALGHGIAQVCAQKGFQVSLTDVSDEIVERGMQRIRAFLKGSLERGKMTEEETVTTLNRIKGTSNLEEAARDVDLVIEAVVEDMEVKKSIFKQLDQICQPHTILSSNTSSLSITELASATKRPSKVVGMHWGNPPQIMQGIEVVRTEKSSQEVVDAIVELSKMLGKIPTVCKDSPGFVINRLMFPWRNESMRLYDEGVASFQDIDKAFKVAYDIPMGPFEFSDFTGLEVSLEIANYLYRELKRDIFKPAQCWIMKVKAGDLGRKTGRGFYEYRSEGDT